MGPAPSIREGRPWQLSRNHVSLELSSVCVVDASGRIVREAKVASEPEALSAWSADLGLALTRARVALARKLAVILHRMLADGTRFRADRAAGARVSAMA